MGWFRFDRSRAAALAALALGFAGCGSSAAEAPECRLRLTIRPAAPEIAFPDHSMLGGDQFEAELHNGGSVSVLLVEPGDGSEVGWRTPIVQWEVEGPAGRVAIPPGGRCGNINPLESDEIFQLEPGESRRLGEWIPWVRIREPGRYRLTLTYEHRPDLEWRGEPLGEHNRAAMRRLRGSKPCAARSNTVEILVREPASKN